MKIIANIDSLSLMRVNDQYWYLLVANDDNIAHRYTLAETQAQNLSHALTNGIETSFSFNDDNVSCDIVLKNKENGGAGLLFSINGQKASLFRRRLAKPQGSYS